MVQEQSPNDQTSAVSTPWPDAPAQLKRHAHHAHHTCDSATAWDAPRPCSPPVHTAIERDPLHHVWRLGVVECGATAAHGHVLRPRRLDRALVAARSRGSTRDHLNVSRRGRRDRRRFDGFVATVWSTPPATRSRRTKPASLRSASPRVSTATACRSAAFGPQIGGNSSARSQAVKAIRVVVPRRRNPLSSAPRCLSLSQKLYHRTMMN